MRTLQTLRRMSVALPFLAAPALVGVRPGPAVAQRFAADPVEDLRQALRIPVRDPNNKDELSFRQRSLERAVARLRTVSELRRALQLQAAWRDEEAEAAPEVRKIDQDSRTLVAERFRDDLRQAMQSGDAVEETAAADLLSEVGVSIRGSGLPAAPEPPAGVASLMAPELIGLLKSRDAGVREAAARALGKIDPAPVEAAKALGGLLRPDQPVAVRLAATKSLGDIIQVAVAVQSARTPTGVVGTKQDVINAASATLAQLPPGLRDPDPRVRRQALEAVRQAAVALGELIEDPKKPEEFPPPGRPWSPEDRQFVDEVRRGVEAERKNVLPVAEGLRSLAPELRMALRDPDDDIRLAAARALEEVGNAHMRLQRSARSIPPAPPEPATQQGPVPDLPLRRISGEHMPSAKAVVSARLLVTVQKQAEKTADADPLQDLILDELPALADNLCDPDVRVRLAVLDVLEMLGGEAYRAENLLVRALDDPNRFVRWSAVRTLGKTRPVPAAVPGLARRLSDPDLGVRTAATVTVESYGEAARAAIPDLARDITRGDAEVREAAIRSIENLGPGIAGSAVPALTAGLFDRDVRVRRAAAEALGRFGTAARSAEPALRQALSHEDPEERRAVSEALLNMLLKPKGK